ncbi:MAG: endonuclease/exonuclease/phosphatase family protein [Victivallaceae bacterium]|nr:endonuclease/exonuclease/phosphatase family protein [Victivallaceae bacterium]
MKVVFYNIAYGTGNPGGKLGQLRMAYRYVRTPEVIFRKLAHFLRREKPDVVGIVEADRGSYRTGGLNQVAVLAELLGCASKCAAKYAPSSLLRKLPWLRHQDNVLLSRKIPSETFFYFMPRGTKRLVLACRIGSILFVLVHLALTRKVRQAQLMYLAEILRGEPRVVLMGDFNTFGGAAELTDFLAQSGLVSANLSHLPTYPAWNPLRELDWILCSPGLRMGACRVASEAVYSDHLPLILEILEE